MREGREQSLRHFTRQTSIASSRKRNRVRKGTFGQNRMRESKLRWSNERREEKEEEIGKRGVWARARYCEQVEGWNDTRANDSAREEETRERILATHACGEREA